MIFKQAKTPKNRRFKMEKILDLRVNVSTYVSRTKLMLMTIDNQQHQKICVAKQASE